MKKVLFILMLLTFTLTSYLAIKQFGFHQFQNFNRQNIENTQRVIIEAVDNDKTVDANYKLLQKIAIETKINLQRTGEILDGASGNTLVYYVALGDKEKYFEQLELKSGNYLTEKSPKSVFLSTIATGDSKQIGQVELFHSFDPIEFRPLSAAADQADIRGEYEVGGDQNLAAFKKLAEKNKFMLTISKNSSASGMETPYPYAKLIFQSSLVLCVMFGLAMLYDTVSNYKEIAIRYLFGGNFGDIGIYLWNRYRNSLFLGIGIGISGLLLYLGLVNQFQQFGAFMVFWLKVITPILLVLGIVFLLVWVLASRIKITQMIKNKKPVKILLLVTILAKFGLSLLLVLALQQGLKETIAVKKIMTTDKKWSLLKHYHYLTISASSTSLDGGLMAAENKSFTQLYRELEEKGALYIMPSNYYEEDQEETYSTDFFGAEGRRVELNNNYLAINPIIDAENRKINISSKKFANTLTALVPLKYKKYQTRIKKTLQADYEDIYSNKTNKAPNIKLIYVKDGQSYFSYSTDFAKDNTYQLIDPIAVIITPYANSQYLSNKLAMGRGYFPKNHTNEKPFAQTKQLLKKYGFDNYWTPSGSAYFWVETDSKNNKESLEIGISYILLSTVLLMNLAIFSIIFYIEANKQVLAVQKLFGYHFIEKHGLVYLTLFAFWSLVYMGELIMAEQHVLLWQIVLTLAIVDFIFISVFLAIRERKIVKPAIVNV